MVHNQHYSLVCENNKTRTHGMGWTSDQVRLLNDPEIGNIAVDC
jgi:hypothetical protein